MARPRIARDQTVVVILSSARRELGRRLALPGVDAARCALMLIAGRGEAGLVAGDRLRVERVDGDG